jgi:RHS repeat-associated protein
MSSVNILGYAAAFLDAVTGAYPLGDGYRMYLPSLMRFSAPDDASPFGAGGVNCYAYCAGDPINRADPTGHNPLSVEEIYNEIRREVQPMERLPGRAAEHPDSNLDSVAEAQAANPVHLGQGISRAGQADGSMADFPRAPKQRAPHELGLLPPPLIIDSIPTDPVAVNRLVTAAYYLGQLRVVPYDDIDSTLIAEWQVNIELNGRSLDAMDPRLDDLLKPLGFSRQNNFVDRRIPWILSVEETYPSNVLVNIALGGPNPGPDGFRLIHLRRDIPSTFRYPKRQYSREFKREVIHYLELASGGQP